MGHHPNRSGTQGGHTGPKVNGPPVRNPVRRFNIEQARRRGAGDALHALFVENGGINAVRANLRQNLYQSGLLPGQGPVSMTRRNNDGTRADLDELLRDTIIEYEAAEASDNDDNLDGSFDSGYDADSNSDDEDRATRQSEEPATTVQTESEITTPPQPSARAFPVAITPTSEITGAIARLRMHTPPPAMRSGGYTTAPPPSPETPPTVARS